MTSSAAAKAYYRQSDYYATTPGEWLGSGAKRLGLDDRTSPEQFDSLADNLDPRTGKSLTTYTRDKRRVGLDMTFNSTKSVGIARELAGPENAGDPRIEEAHREAVAYTVGLIEKDMQARVRVGGRTDNRTTGNLVAYRVTHRDTRISADDGKPDPSLHDHCFIFNATYDPVERKWKAAEIGQIKHDAPFYEAIYHNRLASNLRTLGYGIRREGKAFEVAGISRDLIQKFSRRTAYIESVAGKLGIKNPKSKDKLGATTRLGKAKELADDLNAYYVSRLTDKEREQLADLEGKKSYASNERDAVAYAIGHEFERKSVVEERKLYETALRHGIGSVTPDGVMAESHRQGVLLKDGEATTRAVLAEESRIIALAREGRGTMRPLRDSYPEPDTDTLSPEQQALCRHVWESPDRVILVRGAAGTGKTTAMRSAIAGIDRPVTVLAPSAEASRGVLRREGFMDADTVASFLQSEERQQRARNGVIWVDEAGLMPVKDLSRLTEIARQQNARLVLQGDPKQHKSPARHGNMFGVLQEYAGLPVAELRDIKRQRGQYKQAVALIEKGEFVKAHDMLDDLGYIRQVESDKDLVADYMAGLKAGKSMLVVAPTHAEGDAITAEIRAALKKEGKLKDEHVVEKLVPLAWTEAERGDLERYDGTEVFRFHRNCGPIRAGQVVAVTDWKLEYPALRASSFAVYSRASIGLAVGDHIRITAAGKTLDGKHRLDNGSHYRVRGFDAEGNITLDNGWVLGKGFGFLDHSYVSTSHAAQGKTVDRVLIAMGSESMPAINAEQFYVSASRGRESARIYTDLSSEKLREQIQRSDTRKSATELMQPRKKLRRFVVHSREHHRLLRDREQSVTRDVVRHPEVDHARQQEMGR
jgi:conjugative relaxase-like TrwC/TraI family protein